MTGNSVLSMVMTLVIYALIGIFIVGVFFSVFPFLAIILLMGLAVSAVVSVVNRIRFGHAKATKEKKFDEYGNRRTHATIVGMEESPSPKIQDQDKKDSAE